MKRRANLAGSHLRRLRDHYTFITKLQLVIRLRGATILRYRPGFVHIHLYAHACGWLWDVLPKYAAFTGFGWQPLLPRRAFCSAVNALRQAVGLGLQHAALRRPCLCPGSRTPVVYADGCCRASLPKVLLFLFIAFL